jgi:hypothetical protein
MRLCGADDGGQREELVDEKNWRLALGVVEMWTINKKENHEKEKKIRGNKEGNKKEKGRVL